LGREFGGSGWWRRIFRFFGYIRFEWNKWFVWYIRIFWYVWIVRYKWNFRNGR